VAAAIALHTRPERDILIKRGSPGTELDPSSDSLDGHTTKVGINATLAINRRRPVHKNRVPQHLLDAIDLSELLLQADSAAIRSDVGSTA
jgi:3-polyprenyl-4-hydroxybenzoate decarboxylase